MPPYVWMHPLYVWTPPNVWMTHVCLNIPICSDPPVWLDDPCMFEHSNMFRSPLYVWMPPYVWMHPLYVWMPPYVWLSTCMFGCPCVCLEDAWMPAVHIQHKESLFCLTEGVSICPPYIWMPHMF